MTYSNEDVRRLLRRVEDSELEFKEVVFKGGEPVSPEWDVWADEIAALANTCGGAILCGVTDDGQVQGMSRQEMDELVKLLDGVCHDSIKPPVSVQVRRMEPEENRAILFVEVPQGFTTHGSPGGSFFRIGSRKCRMNSDEIMRLTQQRSQTRSLSFDERPVQNTGVGTLSEMLWKPLLSAEGAASPKAALRKLSLLAPDENGIVCATVAGLLLCSEHPEEWLPNASITATHYRGEDRASGQVDAQEITGPSDQQVSAAVKFMIRNMSVAARKTPARIDLPQYSKRVVFEALVNAVAHRDYSMRGSRIRLSMFANRLEIQSPGSLPNSLTTKSLSSRTATRNEALASMLRRVPASGIPGSEDRLHLMGQRGDGVPIIQRETIQLCDQPPVYKLIDDAELLLVLPAADREQDSTHAASTKRDDSAKRAGGIFSPGSSAIPNNSQIPPAPGE